MYRAAETHRGGGEHTSFIHGTPPPMLSQPPSSVESRYVAVCLEHMGPSLHVCHVAPKAKPRHSNLSWASWNVAFRKKKKANLLNPIFYASFFFSLINVHTVYIACILHHHHLTYPQDNIRDFSSSSSSSSYKCVNGLQWSNNRAVFGCYTSTWFTRYPLHFDYCKNPFTVCLPQRCCFLIK